MDKKKPKMQDPPRYPKVTVPIDNDCKLEYGKALKSMVLMLKVEINELYK